MVIHDKISQFNSDRIIHVTQLLSDMIIRVTERSQFKLGVIKKGIMLGPNSDSFLKGITFGSKAIFVNVC